MQIEGFETNTLPTFIAVQKLLDWILLSFLRKFQRSSQILHSFSLLRIETSRGLLATINAAADRKNYIEKKTAEKSLIIIIEQKTVSFRFLA